MSLSILRQGVMAVLLLACTTAQAEMLPLSDAIGGGASFPYATLRCTGLYVSVLALDLPAGFEVIRPALVEKLRLSFSFSVFNQMESGKMTEVAARTKVREDVAAFAGAYTQMWNENYIGSGNYLDERFDLDATVCSKVIEQ